jgi:hypothetical protein
LAIRKAVRELGDQAVHLLTPEVHEQALRGDEDAA